MAEQESERRVPQHLSGPAATSQRCDRVMVVAGLRAGRAHVTSRSFEKEWAIGPLASLTRTRRRDRASGRAIVLRDAVARALTTAPSHAGVSPAPENILILMGGGARAARDAVAWTRSIAYPFSSSSLTTVAGKSIPRAFSSARATPFLARSARSAHRGRSLGRVRPGRRSPLAVGSDPSTTRRHAPRSRSRADHR